MSDWDDFLKKVKDAETALGHPQEIWYRGQTDSSWALIPGLLRNDEWKTKEKLLFYEYKKTASRLFEKRFSDWEILFDMQHYWIPTRLLDWTTVMGIAIAFILYSEYTSEGDSALFVLDPISLNRLSGREEIVSIPDDKSFKYTEMYWNGRPSVPQNPIAIQPQPRHENDRLHAQKGTFTVHGLNEQGVEVTAESCIRKIILPQSAKKEARLFLKWGNLDEYTIYPDIVGMARHIKRKILNTEV